MRIECLDDLMILLFERICHASEGTLQIEKRSRTFIRAKPFEFQLERGRLFIVPAKSKKERNNHFCNVFVNPPSKTSGHLVAISSANLDDLSIRIVELATAIEARSLRSGHLTYTQWVSLTQSIEQLRDSRAHLIIDEGFTFSKLYKFFVDFVDNHGPIDKVFIDSTCLSNDLQNRLTQSAGDKGLLEPFTRLALKLGCAVVFFH